MARRLGGNRRCCSCLDAGGGSPVRRRPSGGSWRCAQSGSELTWMPCATQGEIEPAGSERQCCGDPGASAWGTLDAQSASERGETIVESEQAGSVEVGAADSVVPYLEV